MLYITYALNGLLMIALPLVLGWFLSKRFGLRWGLFIFGTVSFAASQVVHFPLLYGLTALFQSGTLPAVPAAYRAVFNAVVLGLLAGVCEGLARYLLLRYWAKSARSWGAALMFGAGHGGLEAIIFGALVLVSYGYMVAYRGLDLATLGFAAEDQALLARQLAAYWSAPWYLTLLGAVERLFALCLHLSAAALVMRAITRHNLLWLLAAIAWHALVDASVVLAPSAGWGMLQIEGMMGVYALLSVGLIFALRPRQPEPAVAPEPSTVVTGAPPSPRLAPGVAADTQAQIDQSKYTE